MANGNAICSMESFQIVDDANLAPSAPCISRGWEWAAIGSECQTANRNGPSCGSCVGSQACGQQAASGVGPLRRTTSCSCQSTRCPHPARVASVATDADTGTLVSATLHAAECSTTFLANLCSRTCHYQQTTTVSSARQSGMTAK